MNHRIWISCLNLFYKMSHHVSNKLYRVKIGRYQYRRTGGTCSPPATPHRLLYPKWLMTSENGSNQSFLSGDIRYCPVSFKCKTIFEKYQVADIKQNISGYFQKSIYFHFLPESIFLISQQPNIPESNFCTQNKHYYILPSSTPTSTSTTTWVEISFKPN